MFREFLVAPRTLVFPDQDHHINSGLQLSCTVLQVLPRPAADSVAPDGISDCLTYGDPVAVMFQAVVFPEYDRSTACPAEPG